MKKYLSFLFVLSFMYACSDIEGNLVGVSGRDTWYPDVLGPGKVPLGMVYVPSGAYQAGEDDEEGAGGREVPQPLNTNRAAVQAAWSSPPGWDAPWAVMKVRDACC